MRRLITAGDRVAGRQTAPRTKPGDGRSACRRSPGGHHTEGDRSAIRDRLDSRSALRPRHRRAEREHVCGAGRRRSRRRRPRHRRRALPRVSAATQCPIPNIIISATHTHSANTRGLGQGPPTTKTVADAIVEAATVAMGQGGAGSHRLWHHARGPQREPRSVQPQVGVASGPNPSGPSDKTLAASNSSAPTTCRLA